MLSFKIYQINGDRDVNRMRFERYENLEKFQGSKDVNSSIYDKVWEGTISGSSLEDIYVMFNRNHPEDFRGHSLSVSDVVEITDSSSGLLSGFYFCDSFGFQKVEFEPEKTKDCFSKEMMKVLFLEPGRVARAVEVGTNLKDMHNLIGGYVETLYPFEDKVCIVCDRDAKNKNNFSLNRAIRDENSREILDIIAGPCFICSVGNEKLTGLSDEMLKKYETKFRLPEEFVRVDGKWDSFTYEPQEEVVKPSLDSRIKSANDKTPVNNNDNVPGKVTEPDR